MRPHRPDDPGQNELRCGGLELHISCSSGSAIEYTIRRLSPGRGLLFAALLSLLVALVSPFTLLHLHDPEIQIGGRRRTLADVGQLNFLLLSTQAAVSNGRSVILLVRSSLLCPQLLNVMWDVCCIAAAVSAAMPTPVHHMNVLCRSQAQPRLCASQRAGPLQRIARVSPWCRASASSCAAAACWLPNLGAATAATLCRRSACAT